MLQKIIPWSTCQYCFGKKSSVANVLLLIHRSFQTTSAKTKSMPHVAEHIRSKYCQNIVAVVGAGISTPSGIPDFRSAGSGLYDNLDEYELSQPTDIFDLYFFKQNPKPFFKLAKELYPGNYKPNYVHYFLKLLSDKKKLLRIYTQNIDALETMSGVPEDELIEAHGSFRTATCMKCKEKYTAEFIKADIMNGMIPHCPQDWCKEKGTSQGVDVQNQGVIKPDVVFFGEDLPRNFFQYHSDLSKADLMLVLGTSLEVFPVASLVYEAPISLPRILINKEIVVPFDRDNRNSDVIYCGDIMEGIKELVTELDWEKDMTELMTP